MKNVYQFIEEFESYARKKNELWPYSGHSYWGALLFKNIGNNKRYLLKPFGSPNVGGKKILDFVSAKPNHKGHAINNYIFVANSFKEISKRIAKSHKNITLIIPDFKEKSIKVHGSMNIDLNILNFFIEFAEYLEFSVSYDFEGILKHQSFKQKGMKTITQIEERITSPKVFFSYSWDDRLHQKWVLKLASELLKNGVDVLVDEWDLDKYNNDLHLFMESGIRESDKVIMVCTPIYAEKANKRKGGVGVENTIITGEFYDPQKGNKFIPIVRSYKESLTSSLPTYLKTKYSIDFSSDEDFLDKFDELLRKILSVPRYEKPILGKLPHLKSHII